MSSNARVKATLTGDFWITDQIEHPLETLHNSFITPINEYLTDSRYVIQSRFRIYDSGDWVLDRMIYALFEGEDTVRQDEETYVLFRRTPNNIVAWLGIDAINNVDKAPDKVRYLIQAHPAYMI